MGSNSMPVRIAHGWAIAWLDFYQTPCIVTEGVFSEVKGFFREIARPAGNFPHNHVNPQNAETNASGAQGSMQRRATRGRSRGAREDGVTTARGGVPPPARRFPPAGWLLGTRRDRVRLDSSLPELR
eukprot:CAMPEP_0170242494 /NCGR_PEP_ID=MMETSP0116_2-20130129/21019_1 /TAXON_ID=400756 /ORGANISM="Durinskia baltica, Strain CSIRO CS-38" /LENGTH=126 /DNA_ID=CAMNT_0010493341 /DNA_START=81 /DNA_END=459 /DNA_ORIENTATION=-